MELASSPGRFVPWKNIVVFADGSDEGLCRVRSALELARPREAHVEVRHFADAPPMPFPGEVSERGDIMFEALQAAQEKADVEKRAIEAVGPLGRTFSVYARPVQYLQRAVSLASRGADLVIVGQPEKGGKQDQVLSGALFGSGAPCLVLPRWVISPKWGRRVLVAWKGTAESARAVLAALPLLVEAEQVRVLVVDSRGEEEGEDIETLRRIIVRWQRHGVKNIDEPVLVKSEFGEAPAAIADEAEGFGADLLVMGAYGHARAAEWVFGGVTRHMARHSRLPILMAH
jgi:nucleotide-binding universal stress UspA family protein